MGQALYRTYRSRGLSEIVGQEHITDTLARALKAGRISHAYLFTGPRGTGKTSVARIMAHEINGLPYSDQPNLDIIEIDAASNRRIDDIRDLREKVHITPIHAKYKVYIIDEVHMLTGESFNALLKTLEEPPAHVVFILATTEVHKLPATIISRTQRFTFRPGSKEKVVVHLKTIAGKENIGIEDAALELIAEHSDGSFRDSLSLLDQLTHISAGKITAAEVASTLGLAPKAQVETLVAAALTGDHAAIAHTLSELETQGSAASSLVNQLCQLLTDQAAANPAVYRLIDTLLEVPRAYSPNLKLLTTLVQFTPKATPKPEAKTVATIAAAEPVMSITMTPTKPKTEPKTTSTNTVTTPLKQLSPDDWQHVLAAVKIANPPIFAVIKQAQPVLAQGALHLTFKYALHGKKLDDPKQKALVAEIIQATLGVTPIITTAIDKSATPVVFADSPHIKSVTDIMGGGEVINAQTI